MSSVLEAMKGPIGVAFLTMVTVLLVSKFLVRSLWPLVLVWDATAGERGTNEVPETPTPHTVLIN